MAINSSGPGPTTQVGFMGFWPDYGKLSGGEAAGASQVAGKDIIAQTQELYVDSFLTDRPPPQIEPEEAIAEIRWGQKSNFQYDDTTGRFDEQDDYYVQADYSSEGFDGFDLDTSFEGEEVVPDGEALIYDVQEKNRQIETVRVPIVNTTSGATIGYAEIERIKSVSFEMPERVGPTGTVRVFYTFHMNWGKTS